MVLAPRASLIDNSLAKACALKRARAGLSFSAERSAKRSKSGGILKIMPSSRPSDGERELCPYAFIRSMLVGGGEADAAEEPARQRQPLHATEFIPPTAEQIAAYSHEAIAAVRAGDVDALRRIQLGGGSLRCCNRFGESLLHVACRRASADVVSFLLNEAGVSPRIRDDYGRTPLHDACWRGNPQYEIVELLLKAEPRLAFVKDVRGHRPFEYARREHWGAWREFLNEKRGLILAC